MDMDSIKNAIYSMAILFILYFIARFIEQFLVG